MRAEEDLAALMQPEAKNGDSQQVILLRIETKAGHERQAGYQANQRSTGCVLVPVLSVWGIKSSWVTGGPASANRFVRFHVGAKNGVDASLIAALLPKPAEVVASNRMVTISFGAA